LRSNFFLVLATLGAGYVALRVYQNQKRDEKRNAASILLLEIGGAEDALTKVNSDKPIVGIDEADVFLMKTSSWDKYKYLFATDFKDKNEFSKISEFYDKCKEYDDAVRLRNASFYHNQKQLRINAHRIIARYTDEYAINLEGAKDEEQKDTLSRKYMAKRKLFEDAYIGQDAPNIFTYLPLQPFNNAKRVLGTIDRNLSTSSAGERLKELAAPK